jgi:hypothetical protein
MAEGGGGRIVYLSTFLFLIYAFNIFFFLKFINKYFIDETDSKQTKNSDKNPDLLMEFKFL